MKRYIIALGTLLVTVILLSGTAVGTTYYSTDIINYTNVTNPSDILLAPDGDDASIGETISSTDYLGKIWIYFDTYGPPQQGDTVLVYGGGGGIIAETYQFRLGCDNWPGTQCHTAWDTGNSDLVISAMTVPADCASHGEPWTHVDISAESGISDPIYGPEIDAVGFEH